MRPVLHRLNEKEGHLAGRIWFSSCLVLRYLSEVEEEMSSIYLYIKSGAQAETIQVLLLGKSIHLEVRKKRTQ